MVYDGRSVANYFIKLAAGEGKLLTHLKLQKLLYYAHGWHLVIFNGPLVEGGFEAWPHGPVARNVFEFFKMFKGDPITVPAMYSIPTGDGFGDWEPFPMPQDKGLISFLHKVYSKYKPYTAKQLSAATHAPNSPWAKITDGGKKRKLKLPISDELIKEYFLTRSAKAKEHRT
jgi:uncharacterized phage-associated protein